MSRNGTTFEFSAAKKTTPANAVLIVPLISTPKPPMQLVSQVDKLCAGAVSTLIEAKALSDDSGKLAHTASSNGCRRVVVVSLGDAKSLKPHQLRTAAGSVAKWLIGEQISNAVLWFDGLASCGVDNPAYDWATGMAYAGFRFEQLKKPDEKAPCKVKITIAGRDKNAGKHVLPQLREGLAMGDAVNYTRQLILKPANVINPATLAAEAKKLSRQYGMKCTVLEGKKLEELKMGGLISVGKGAQFPGRLIRVDYKGAPGVRKTTVIVGKALTHDTGGYSIKPAAGLVGGKFDKSGGCTVLGVLKAAAALKLKCNIVGLVAAAQNMISKESYLPGDIITMSNGKTVEVTNTDAEGRLVLADALVYAQKFCKPTSLIDVATLTGGVVVSLGNICAGLMGNDDDLADALEESGRQVHERLWRLPLWDEYKDLMKGTDGDLVNSSAKRDAHCIQGGIFLKEFVEDDVSWAHVDIAGVASDSSNEKSASGFGVRLFIEYVRRHLI